jgi:hypothetical protein
VTQVDARLAAALTIQLELWRAALAGGAQRVSWKLGVGDRERIGDGPVVGHLTSATQLEPNAGYRTGGAAMLSADAELGIELGRDLEPGADRDAAQAAISGYGAALELVDLNQPESDPEEIRLAGRAERAECPRRLVRRRLLHQCGSVHRPLLPQPLDLGLVYRPGAPLTRTDLPAGGHGPPWGSIRCLLRAASAA